MLEGQATLTVKEKCGKLTRLYRWLSISQNAGGTTYTDSNNRTWSVDAYFNSGKVLVNEFTREIKDTVDDPLYHFERWADAPFAYEVPVPDGLFNIMLYIAKLYSKAQGPSRFIRPMPFQVDLILQPTLITMFKRLFQLMESFPIRMGLEQDSFYGTDEMVNKRWDLVKRPISLFLLGSTISLSR